MQLKCSQAQKRSKDIGKIVHVTLVVQQSFYEATKILFVRKEEELLNKVVIFVFFPHKKYSHCFVILQLNISVVLLSMTGFFQGGASTCQGGREHLLI